MAIGVLQKIPLMCGLFEEEAQTANRRFLQAIDTFTGSVVLFDEHERIIAYNKKYAENTLALGDELKIGLTFPRCLEILLEHKTIPQAARSRANVDA